MDIDHVDNGKRKGGFENSHPTERILQRIRWAANGEWKDSAFRNQNVNFNILKINKYILH